jgi:hypothetical protein
MVEFDTQRLPTYQGAFQTNCYISLTEISDRDFFALDDELRGSEGQWKPVRPLNYE